MKRIFIFSAAFLICGGNLFGDSATISLYDSYFNQINEVRVGLNNKDIDKIANPFITLPRQVVQVASSGNGTAKPTYKLTAIIEDKVKINNSWLKKGSVINGMRVTTIKPQSVVLRSANRAIELFLREKNENSIITTN